ncbi:MAG: hypothetical protein PHT69_02620 [Bacteroidales bacterium]|nr:hypothetical protein [Bacteroidales bacterium]
MARNHRVLAHEHNGEIYLQIHEVFYNENNIPDGYTKIPATIGGDDLKSITFTLNKMMACRNKPILWAGDKFPNECKVKYICNLCGRNTFDNPTPHKCAGGFRKRGLKWSINYINP